MSIMKIAEDVDRDGQCLVQKEDEMCSSSKTLPRLSAACACIYRHILACRCPWLSRQSVIETASKDTSSDGEEEDEKRGFGE